ncbi:hypothetical protein LSCM1_03073 [Leishmania martiniquensis]|uniref:Uncharacterized protein n=1 Tax=Leishmania martiniquensis TaxID=1580590 RepID=A0A836KQB8_9TRYP|nr:hypothetical protein LSCM1_03073 [Leishmania martiniquensis]
MSTTTDCTAPAPRGPAAAPVWGSDSFTNAHNTFKELCDSYVERYMLQRHQIEHRSTLQARDSVNVQTSNVAKDQVSLAAAAAASPSLTAPSELTREYARMKEEAITQCQRHDALVELSARSTEELEAENAYLRALVLRLEKHYRHVTSFEAPTVEVVPSLPSPSTAPLGESMPVTQHRRSPSAACPDRLIKEAEGPGPWRVFRSGSEASPAPATSHQVSELQEQIDLLREAVRELSQRASVTRGHSASPMPAEGAAPSMQPRALSPFPRCATPTCTTDVRTLQRIIMHQQQTIRTLEQEMEDVHKAKEQMEQAMTQLREATAAMEVRDGVGAEDEDVGMLDATTHWRSACLTEDRTSSCIPLVETTSGDYAYQETVDPVCNSSTAVAAGEGAIAQEMLNIDVEAAAEQVPEKRRAATFGGMRPPLWFDCTTALADPVRLPGAVAMAVEYGDEDEPSSGTRTPLPRRTVVLHQRLSSAVGDTSSVSGGAGVDESPFTRRTQMSCGTGSNRRTSAAGSFAAL